MKNFKLLLFILFPLISLAQTPKIKYLDFEGKEISYSQFNKIQSKGILVGQNDDGTIYRLIKEREKSGKINDYKELINYLNNSLSTNLDFKNPIFIYYYPGPDATNISKNPNPDGSKIFRNDTDIFENKFQKAINGQTLFLYKKESKNVYSNHEYMPWKKDPNNEIEKRFFSEYHYQYASFVIIFPNGEYNAYLGEFSYDYVFDYVKSWKKKNRSK